MGKMDKIRETSRKIVDSLRQMSNNITIKGGAEIELIPKPVVRFFAEIHIHNLHTKQKRDEQHADEREKGIKSLRSDDESIIERDST